MTGWLLLRGVRRAPRRLLLGAVGVAFPVAILAATLFFVDLSVRSMTRVALAPVQVEMRGIATTLNADMGDVSRRLAAVPGVSHVDRFAAADVVVGTSGGRATARLFAVDPAYLRHHSWVHGDAAGLSGGALLNPQLQATLGPGPAGRAVSIELPGHGGTLLRAPARGGVDLRDAFTWFEIPYGDVQGDLALVPRAIVVDYASFQRAVLPALRAALGPQTAVFNPGLTELPPATLEAHVSVDHRAYPGDPGRAVHYSASLRRVLERHAPGEVIVADNAAEALTLASADATNAKILFLLLGIPGVLAAAALGLATESALAEAQRREDALLRLRGASDGQLARLAAALALVAGVAGALIGLVVAATVVSAT
ncbi:MAG: hypothetical protein M3155_04810, partial [Actinomycetota bacterium]|nr:hypothetical protein [Actinomycetota bacterium]